MKLGQKYQALLTEAERRRLADIDQIRLCFETLSLAQAIDKDCATLLAKYELSEARFIMLFLLDASPEGVSPKTLAARAGITRATVTGLIDGLEQAALITRHVTPSDRRALTIHLTARGKELATTLFAQHSRWIASLFAGLSAAECTQLSYLLNKVAMQLHGAHT